MSCLAAKYNPRVGPVLNVVVLPPGQLKAGGQPPADLQTFLALVDTGASGTCISPLVAQAIGLSPTGKRPMAGATGAVPMNVYIADVLLPFGSSFGYAQHGMEVMEFHAVGLPYQVLLGRDIICNGVLTLSFDGHMTFSL